MTTELSDLRLQLQKISYESKENAITVDSLKEANQELMVELEELKKNLAEMRVPSKDAADGEKEKKKAEKMAQMMSGFDASGEINEKERQIRDALNKLDGDSHGQLTIEERASLIKKLEESKALLKGHEEKIGNLTKEKDKLKDQVKTLESEYEELLDKSIADEEKKEDDISDTISTLKRKLEDQYASKKESQQREIDELKQELNQKNEKYDKLKESMDDLQNANDQLQSALAEQPVQAQNGNLSDREKELERMRKSMASQLAEFEVMKKALMRDLQQRCEKVVELEMSLDETREQYNNVLRASNNKAQQKKMAFLERNLEQLTNVQKQLVEQNASLKKEVALAERKLIARTERIQSLETLLQDAQEKLISQNQKFEAQLQAVRERLEQARSQKSQNAMAALNFGRIAKPLRGGGTVVENGDSNSPTSPTDKRDKRSSWIPGFMNGR